MRKTLHSDAQAKLKELGIFTGVKTADIELASRFYDCDHPQRRVPGEIEARLRFALATLQTLRRSEFITGEFAKGYKMQRDERGNYVMVERFSPPKSQRIAEAEGEILKQIIELATELLPDNANGRSGGPAIH